jgi:hypothetical protein
MRSRLLHLFEGLCKNPPNLLQISLVYVNTLMIQDVLRDPGWLARLTAEDYRALTPLIYSHVNPYGTFQLDMTTRLPIAEALAA